ncbi:MAG: GatB/YqeY domain-containing protein, partial [Burkholderiales bacterium]|nr:GatB/YqeY domain-containing protein [Burkholderiales bacterium]
SDTEVEAAVAAAIAEAGAAGPQAMGKVMVLLKAKLVGRADMSRVSALVKSRLTG